jgi:hypothetical protein
MVTNVSVTPLSRPHVVPGAERRQTLCVNPLTALVAPSMMIEDGFS